MSASKKTKTNQTTSGTTNTVQTPTNPAYVTQGLGAIGGNVAKLAGQDPYSFVAGPDPLQTQAATGAGNLVTPSGFAAANGVASDVASAGAPSISGHLAEFQNPYTDQVVNTTLAGFDQSAGRQQAQDKLGLAGDSTFGGSGGSILQALDNQNLSLGRAQTEAGLRNQGFQTALGGATSQAGLDAQNQAQHLAAAGVLSGNATALGANDRANIDTQGGIGSILQALAQTRAGAPINTAGSLASIFGNPAFQLTHGVNQDGTANSTSSGTSTTTSSDPLGSLGSLFQGLGGLGFHPFGSPAGGH